MRLDYEMIKAFEKNNMFRHIKKIPKNDNIYEYGIETYDFGNVTGTLYLENEIIDDFDCTIGYFGVSFEHKVFAYNIKRESKK